MRRRVGERIGARHDIVRCLGQLAWARWLLGDEDEARALAARGHKLLAEVTVPNGGAFLFGSQAHAAVARVLVATGAAEQGETLLHPLLTAAQRTGWREAVASSELVLGLCLEARGELERAVADAHTRRRHRRRTRDSRGRLGSARRAGSSGSRAR